MNTIIAMFTFSLVMSISPGPVNMIIVSSGINNGFKNTFSFISGATVGFTLLLAFIALGFYKVVELFPAFFTYLSFFGSSFIIYMGYKIITSSAPLDIDDSESKIPKFYEGLLLQWLNPKAWIASVSGVSLFSLSETILFTFVLIYFFICYIGLSFWGLLGAKLSRYFKIEKRLKVFNIFMGSLLIITAIYLFYIQFI